MAKCSYSFPAKSRKAMIDAMESIGGYAGWYAPRRAAFPFSWNVKLSYTRTDATTLEPFRYGEGEPFNPAWDANFDTFTEGDGFSESLIERMRWQLEDYSTYPGDDSGEFEFEFAGRSGGHLVLTRAFGNLLAGLDFDEMRDTESGWSFQEVRRLYRAVTCMDSDFSRKAVKRAERDAMAYERIEWESRRRDRIAELRAEVTSDERTAQVLVESAINHPVPEHAATLRQLAFDHEHKAGLAKAQAERLESGRESDDD